MAKYKLQEMPDVHNTVIRQNYNHPSIVCCGLFNELKEEGDNPIPYIRELNQLAHQEDTARPTTSASIYHQQDTLKQPAPAGYWHPENWKTYYHIENWKIIHERPFVWGSFVWNMFDFGAAHRHEGDRPGINDKGLVTFDRKVRKDAFYFCKANWNTTQPVLHLASKRNTNRTKALQDFMVFTNQPQAELFVNGVSFGKLQPDAYGIIQWKNISLQSGCNRVEARSGYRKTLLRDGMELYYQK